MKIFCTPVNGFDRHELVYALLEFAFRENYKTDMPKIEKTADGKPFFPSAMDIHFSLSHTKTHVLCAIGTAPVGADIETVRSIRPALNKRVRTEEEIAHFDFFQSWVLKESYIKLYGKPGLDLKDICFTKKGHKIVPPKPEIYSKLYDDISGCCAAVCSFTDDFPDEITVVSTENLKFSS